MKSTYQYIMSSLLVAGALISCSPEEFEGVTEGGVPQASTYADLVSINVDQSINQVTFSTGVKDVYAIWSIDNGKKVTKKTGSEFEQIFTTAGDYTVTIQIGNRNGLSDGSITKTFHIDNTIVDFSKYITNISKATWYMDRYTQGHMACGPSANDPASWWSGEPDCKATVGIYDNYLNFSADMKYTYNPGESGVMFVNKGTTLWGTGASEDFTVEVQPQESHYAFEVDGDDLYLTFDANTQFPYIAYDECYTSPRYHVVSLTSKSMTLVAANADIAWQYIFTTSLEVPSEDNPTVTKDWDANASANLWKSVEDGSAFVSVSPWFSPAGWTGGLTPEWNHENGVWQVTMPAGLGSEQWMGQFPINTTLTASMNKKYNFYCVIEADNDCPGVTIKLTETDDADGTKHDNNCFFADRKAVTGGEPFIYKAINVTLPEEDAHALSLFFDFGGTPEGTVVKISDIYFEEVKEVNYEADNNQWKMVDNGTAFLSVTPWFSPAGWTGGLNCDWTHENGSDTWQVTMPEGLGSEQWMGQFPINTTLTASKDKTYDFSVTLVADNDCPGVTIKLTETDDADGTKHDSNCFFADRHVLTADEEFVYKVTGVQLPEQDAHALSLFFDFGGTPAGTVVKIKKITFIED